MRTITPFVRPVNVGPSVPKELRKKRQEEEQVNQPEEQSRDNIYNPDFVREWERANPGYKVEELSMNVAPSEIINVNANDLRNKNWYIQDQVNKDKEQNKTIRTNRITPLSKGAKRQGHISYLLNQASQNELELFDLWTNGKNQRAQTRLKYGW